jgi:multiple sugar transport system ATP-binding protein
MLLGPSGCGKTTTLRMIAGLELPTSGEILIDGEDVSQRPASQRDIAMVFQMFALYPHLNVRRNIAYPLVSQGVPRHEVRTRVAEVARILGIESILDRPVGGLSGGDRQRVALGRAIVRQPKVFLFDEPLSNLDAKMRVQMRTEITKLHQKLQATMIYVTHDQVEAMTMGTRIVVMKDGVIQQADEPLTIYHNPANLFVAGFLGSPPMNFVQGRVEPDAGGLIFREARGGPIAVTLGNPPGYASCAGREVTLGVRPEHCELATGTETSPPDSFEALVELVEPMGAETYFYLNTGTHPLICRSPAETTHRSDGHRMRFRIQAHRVHLFDPASGERIPSS